jgi:hypothetical protein
MLAPWVVATVLALMIWRVVYYIRMARRSASFRHRPPVQ